MKLSDLGPGLLLAATGIGVGDMVSSTIAGAEYGLTLLWALAAGVVVKFAITEGAARWQLATGTTLVEGWRDHLPRAAVLAFFVYFVVWSYFVSSALVAASALVPAAIIPSVPLPVWGVIHAVAAFVMVYFGRYERFLSIIKWFIGLKFGAVIATALLIVLWSGADWSGAGARSAVLDRVHAVAHRRRRRHGHAAVVRLLDARGRVVGTRAPVVGARRSDRVVRARLRLLRLDDLPRDADRLAGQILDEGPRLCLLLADRIGEEIGPVGRAIFLLGFWGAAFSSVLGVWHGVPFLFDDWFTCGGGSRPAAAGRAYRTGRPTSRWRPSRRSSFGGRCGSCSPTRSSGRCSFRSSSRRCSG